MPTENLHGNQKNVPDESKKNMPVGLREMNLSDNQQNEKFPKWDIVPPNQFINPRIKKAE